MSESLNLVYESIDQTNADKSAATRRQLVAGAAATFGSMGLLGIAQEAEAATPAVAAQRGNTPQNILNVAATAEVLATIVNTVASEQGQSFFAGLPGDADGAVTLRNVRAAAREELIHFQVLTSALGAKPLTRTVFVPNAFLANATNLLTALEIGDQIFVNAYLIATTTFANSGLRPGTRGRFSRIAAEFMGVEGVHRALARQSLGKLGNDRVFMRYSQPEDARPPIPGNPNRVGFRSINTAVAQLQAAGFGFGKPGNVPGTRFEFDAVRTRTPDDPELSTRTPR